MLGIHECPSCDAQKERMSTLVASKGKSLIHCESLNMNQIYSTKLNEAGEKTRIDRLEMFDEFEEWEILQSHYCITLAVSSSKSEATTQIKI